MGRSRIIFRADGNGEIGMGHIVRTIALANMLKNDFECIFATRFKNDFIVKEIKKCCDKIVVLSNDKHFTEFLDLLSGKEIVVLDNYFFDTDYQKKIKAIGSNLVCIDDIYDKHFVSDLVINQAEGISAKEYSSEKYTKFLLGYKNTLLRPEFLSVAKEYNTFESIAEGRKSALICLGGTDSSQLVKKVTDAFLNHPSIAEVYLISKIDLDRLDNPHGKQIKNFWQLDAEEMKELMLKADLGFVPASSLSIEACACRLPIICGWFVENQIRIYNTLVDKKLCIGVDNLIDADSSFITRAISTISDIIELEKIISSQIESVDGYSDKRILEAIKKIA